MKSQNYYARTVCIGLNSVHAFASRKERDSWVNDDRRNRIEIGAREARGTSRAFGEIIMHARTSVPKSFANIAHVTLPC